MLKLILLIVVVVGIVVLIIGQELYYKRKEKAEAECWERERPQREERERALVADRQRRVKYARELLAQVNCESFRRVAEMELDAHGSGRYDGVEVIIDRIERRLQEQRATRTI